jgi:hypothetical protein
MVLTVFEMDTVPPHPGVTVSPDGVAARDTNGGWVTLRSTQPLSQACTQWGIRIVDQGETNDGSGLMIGLLPRLQPTAAPMLGSKYISELGGWCLSRAGECYGSWKCEAMPFGTNSVVEFDVDFSAKTVTIVCGRETATGHIPALLEADDVYPAVSMYYMNQKVCFV